MALVACLTSCGTANQEGTAPSSPAELGDRVAQALLSGNTNLISTCLPPAEAYLKVFAMSSTIDRLSDEEMQKYYHRTMDKMIEYVGQFPTDVEKETNLRIADIRKTVVEIGKPDGPLIDVMLTFQTDTSAFMMRLDACLQYNDHWYLIDFDWIGEEKNSEQ